MLYTRISKLCKEDVLRTFDQLSANFHCSADTGLPERKIKYMMKSKRDQCSFHETVYPGSGVSGFQYQITNTVNPFLDRRPCEEHQNTNYCISQC